MKNAPSQYGKVKKQDIKEANKQEQRINKKVNEELLPLLKSLSANVEEFELIPAVLNTVIQQAMINKTFELKLSDLGIEKELKKGDSADAKKFLKVLNILKDESVKTCYTILQGLGEDIAGRKRIYWKDKLIDSLYYDKK